MRNAHAIGYELTAIYLGVLHARILVLLRVGLGGERRQAKAKNCEREHGVNFHGYPQAMRPFFRVFHALEYP